MLPDLGIEYYIYGSGDSLDTDVLIVHPDAKSDAQDRCLWCPIRDNFIEQYPEIWSWGEPNMIWIDNGYVTQSIPSKGSPDAVNNSLFETYHLHEQKYL